MTVYWAQCWILSHVILTDTLGPRWHDCGADEETEFKERLNNMSKVTQQTDSGNQRQAMDCFPHSCSAPVSYKDWKHLVPMTGKRLRAKIHEEQLLGVQVGMRNIVPSIPGLQLIGLIWKGRKASAGGSWMNTFFKIAFGFDQSLFLMANLPRSSLFLSCIIITQQVCVTSTSGGWASPRPPISAFVVGLANLDLHSCLATGNLLCAQVMQTAEAWSSFLQVSAHSPFNDGFFHLDQVGQGSDL